LKEKWQGLNFAVGIPGLLGGAICMNAGTTAGDMASVIEALDIVTPEGQEVRVAGHVLTFGYRRMALPPEHGQTAIVVRAHLRLSEGDGAALRAQARKRMRDRMRTQPLGCACAGSFFKNPSPQMPAGRLIDEAGLKGTSVGDARVSERHANFIVNSGRATAADVLALKALITQTVWERFQISLEPEVRIVGQGEDNQAA
jgi:UDP-N-acetylmuramate dehydrogenase